MSCEAGPAVYLLGSWRRTQQRTLSSLRGVELSGPPTRQRFAGIGAAGRRTCSRVGQLGQVGTWPGIVTGALDAWRR